jgi:hypothetical protein
MKRWMAWLVVGGFLAAALGCSAARLPVQSDYARDVDFGKLANWDWAPQAGTFETPAAGKTADRIQLDALVKQHIEQQLRQRGMNHVTNRPDFRVAWSFGEWQLDKHKRPNGGWGAVGLMYPGLHASVIPTSSDGRAQPPSLDPYSSQYEQAKLEVAILDAGTSRVIWNASVTDDSDFGYFTASQQKRIAAAVDSLMAGFPPLAPGAP